MNGLNEMKPTLHVAGRKLFINWLDYYRFEFEFEFIVIRFDKFSNLRFNLNII